jgi:hypothetical protein
MKRLILVAAFSILVSGCATGERASRLSPGMTKSQVIAVMGRPDGFSLTGKTETFRYTNRVISGWSWDRGDYYATFEGDKLVSWGSGQVRQNQPVQGVMVGFMPPFPSTCR